MRVSEFSKSLKLPAGIVLAQAKVMGLEVTSTLSSLEADEAAQLKSYFSSLSASAREALVAEAAASHKARKERAESDRQADVKKTREQVELHRRAALEADAVKHGHAPSAQESAPVVAEVTPVVAEPVSEPAKVVPEVAPVAKSVEASAPETAKVEPVQSTPVKTETKKAEVKKPVPAKPEKLVATETVVIGQGPQMTSGTTISVPENLENTAVVAPTSIVHEEDDDEDLAESIPVHGARPKTHLQTKPHAGQRAESARGNTHNTHNNNDRRNSQQKSFGKRGQQNKAPAPAAAPAVMHATVTDKTIRLRALLTVKELAELLNIRPNMLIADLMKLNVLASINQRLELDISQKIATKYGFTVVMEERSKRSADRKPALKSEDADDDIPEDKPEEMILRPPVVTFLGHVDHGKTTLMDYVRQTRVAAGEAGGITQHIGAYTIDHNGRRITFIDTPGHAAFSAMRERGANITDIAVIIVAADDGVMPQTKEAIKHARDAGAQMLVAITKCDKPEARPDRVRQMLQGEGLTPEEWGGDIVCCEVSGVTGEGVDNLLEMILLQADVLELQANPNRRANGAVIESQLEQGLGPTATLLVQGGTLHVGDILLCGEFYGKVRALIDERGKRVKDAGPSIAVKCTGLSGVPEAGSTFRVMLNEKRARELAQKAAETNKLQSLSAAQSASMADWTSRLGADGSKELGVILKADTQGTAEAVEASLKDIVSKKVSLKILYVGVGSIAAADVQRAGGDGGAVIVGFNVSCEPGVQTVARQNGVRINTFRIIYELIEHIKRCMLDLIAPEYKEVVRGHAEIRQVFDISKLGRIAGSQMLDGTLRFKGKYRVFRAKSIIYDGPIHTMKHFKEDVQEVTSGQECGLGFGSFEGFREGDIVECYEMEELPKVL